MGRWSLESTGMDVLRPIAIEQLRKDPSKKKRVWSDELEAWGFFVYENEITYQRDMFLLWCSIAPGDRLILNLNPTEGKELQISTVVGVWRADDVDKPSWAFRLIDQFGRLVRIDVDENELFRQAFNLTF